MLTFPFRVYSYQKQNERYQLKGKRNENNCIQPLLGFGVFIKQQLCTE